MVRRRATRTQGAELGHLSLDGGLRHPAYGSRLAGLVYPLQTPPTPAPRAGLVTRSVTTFLPLRNPTQPLHLSLDGPHVTQPNPAAPTLHGYCFMRVSKDFVVNLATCYGVGVNCVHLKFSDFSYLTGYIYSMP